MGAILTPQQIDDRLRQAEEASSAAADAAGTLLAPDEWPDPPAEVAYHGLAGDVARAIDPQTEADSVAVLAQFLVAFGSAAGRHGYRAVGKRRHHGNLFAVLVGPSSKGRKGSAWDWVENLMRDADAAWGEACVQAGLSSGEGLIQAVRDRAAEPGEDAPPPGDKRLLVVEEEFGSTLRVMGREGNILSAVLRQAWDGGRLRTLTRHSPLRATDAHISVLGHITRQELSLLLRSSDQANGFANRILWLAVRRSKLLPDGGREPDGWASLAARVGDAIYHAGRAGPVARSREAAALWHEHYPRLTADRPGALGLATSRAEAQTLRLSVLYALLDGSDEIGVPHLEAALALWDYCERSCRWVFGTSTGSADADEILEALRAAGEAGMNGREVSALFNRHRTAQQIRAALAVLADGRLARCDRSATGGRPAQRWYACEQSEQSEQRERSTPFSAQNGDGG